MELKEAFRIAIMGEIEGRELYRMAAEKTSDKKAQKNFSLLADEEQKHLDVLTKLAQDHNEGKNLQIPDLPKPTSFQDAESPIFTKEFKETIANKDFDMTTLSIGIKLEIEAEKFYREMATTATTPDLKKFLVYLADWEKDHYEYLKKQINFFQSYYATKYDMGRF